MGGGVNALKIVAAPRANRLVEREIITVKSAKCGRLSGPGSGELGLRCKGAADLAARPVSLDPQVSR